jgi:predicted Ser/Thr protein kinase
MAISQTPAVLLVGTLVNGRFRVKKLLGYGGYGNVYLVEDQAVFLGNLYAMKESLSSATSERRQFTREAKWLMALDHPNLPRVAEQFEWNTRPYFVMAYVAGENLEDRVDRLGPLPEDQVLGWMRPICDAVIYLHSQKRPIIHRDIKPGNIIVTKDGRPWLVDFGIAKVLQPGTSRKTTRAARAVSGGYSPLEQYTRGGTDARSDVYALGATLYHLLTGACPPEAPDIVSGVARLPDPRQVYSKISRQTEQVVMRAMRQKPEERFQSVRELLDALPGGASFSVVPAQAATATKSKRSAKSGKAAPAPAAVPAVQPPPEPVTVVAQVPPAAAPQAFVPAQIPPAPTMIEPSPYPPAYMPPPAAAGANALLPQPVQQPSASMQASISSLPLEPASAPPAKQTPPRRRVVLAGIVAMLCALAVLSTIVLTIFSLKTPPNQTPDYLLPHYESFQSGGWSSLALLALIPLAALLLLLLPVFHWLGSMGRGLTYTLLLFLPLVGMAPIIAWIATGHAKPLDALFLDGFYAPLILFALAWVTALAQVIRRR